MNPIFPSILSTDCFDLKSKLEEFERSGIDFIHLDIMDGHFVDNLSFGPSIIKPLKSDNFSFKVDSHLMVSNPDKMIPHFIRKGSDWISFHVEIKDNIEKNIKLIKDGNCKAGLALNPDTNAEEVFPYLPEIDYVLIMSVFPGYGGQKFIQTSLEKAGKIKKKITELGLNCLIQIDGGVNDKNVKVARENGVDIFVIGTYLYNSLDISEKTEKILKNINGE
ncbi:MAG: ribulose-phosphate 3-epimerase [Acidobacteriota bacterium]